MRVFHAKHYGLLTEVQNCAIVPSPVQNSGKATDAICGSTSSRSYSHQGQDETAELEIMARTSPVQRGGPMLKIKSTRKLTQQH